MKIYVIYRTGLVLLFYFLVNNIPSLLAQTEFASIESAHSFAVSAGRSTGTHSVSASGFGIEFSPFGIIAIGASRAEGKTFYKERNDQVDFKAAEGHIKFIGRRMKDKPIGASLTIAYLSYYKSSHGYLLPKNYLVGISVFRDFDFTATSKMAIYPELSAVRLFNSYGSSVEFGGSITLRIGPTRHFGVLISPGVNFSEGERLFSLNAGLIFAD